MLKIIKVPNSNHFGFVMFKFINIFAFTIFFLFEESIDSIGFWGNFGMWDMGNKRQPPMHEIVLEVLEGRKKFHLALLLGHPYHFKVLGCWVNIIIKLIFHKIIFIFLF